MTTLWKALLILAVNIVISFKASGEPTFSMAWPLLCHFTRLCPPGQQGPGSNPFREPLATTPPKVPSSNPSREVAAPPQVAGSIFRRAELILSVVNLADFISEEIERNPVSEVLRNDLAIENGVHLSELSAGKLAGEDENELFRLLGILSEVLAVMKRFRPRDLPGPTDVRPRDLPGTSTLTDASSNPSAPDPATPPTTESVAPHPIPSRRPVVPSVVEIPARRDSGPPQESSEEDYRFMKYTSADSQ